MSMMEAWIAIYLLIYMAVLILICAVGYVKNYQGKSAAEIEEMTKPQA